MSGHGTFSITVDEGSAPHPLSVLKLPIYSAPSEAPPEGVLILTLA